jgi:hypothetical protein
MERGDLSPLPFKLAAVRANGLFPAGIANRAGYRVLRRATRNHPACGNGVVTAKEVPRDEPVM